MISLSRNCNLYERSVLRQTISENIERMNLKNHSTDELLLMAHNLTGEFSDGQVRQVKLELYRRGVDDEVIADIMEEKEEAFMRRLDAAARAEQARMDRLNERNRRVGYRWWEMLPLFLLAPFYLLTPMRRLVGTLILLPVYLLSRTPVNLGEDLFVELRRLKAEKYDRKFRQRLFLLLGGDLCWLVCAWCYG